MNPPTPSRWNLDLADAIPLLRGGAGHLLKKPAEDLLRLTAMNRFLRRLDPATDPATIFQRALDLLALSYRVDHGSVATIPDTGPVIVVANHPFGGGDALVLAHLLAARRKDMRMLANSLLVRMDAVEPWLIGVDPFGDGATSSRRNIGPMKQALAHLRNGGCLGVFPAGEVSAAGGPCTPCPAGQATLEDILPVLEKREHERQLERARLARKRAQKIIQ